MPGSIFIRAMHPKTQIRPDAALIARLMETGWVGQLKMDGHRAQVHIPANPELAIRVYNRQGQPHRQSFTANEQTELRRIFAPQNDWNVIDAEWLKDRGKMYVFDFLKREGQILRGTSYLERWAQLPRAYLSPFLQTLPVLRSAAECLNVFADPHTAGDDSIEGLVFKSAAPGFHDSSIVRCRKKAR